MIGFVKKLGLFYWTGIRIVVVLKRKAVPFYRLRAWAIGFNLALTLLLYLAWLPPVLAHFLAPGRTGITLILSVVAALFLLAILYDIEREQRLFHRYQPFSVYNIGVGSASVLRGPVRVWHLFLNAGGRSWSDEARTRVMHQVETATAWLCEQAKRRSVELSLDHQILAGAGYGFSREVPQAKNRYRTLRELRACLDTLVQRHELRPGREVREACLLVHVPGTLRAYAVPDFLGEDSKTGLEFAVLGKSAPPSVIAHEILHLFGADDFYSKYFNLEYVRKWKRHHTSGLLNTRSIMFSAGLPISGLVVDDLTARSVGWS